MGEILTCKSKIGIGLNWHSKRYPLWNSNLNFGSKITMKKAHEQSKSISSRRETKLWRPGSQQRG
jgi:hypothetical protein